MMTYNVNNETIDNNKCNIVSTMKGNSEVWTNGIGSENIFFQTAINKRRSGGNLENDNRKIY